MSSESQTIEIFDTTLRDGLQVEGVTATVEDKLRIAEQLDVLGVHFIEGGWPGANPKDIEFFARARAASSPSPTSTLVAFGSTRRPRGKVDSDETLRNLLEAATPAVCIVAKSSAYHVTQALQTTLDEGEAMIADSVRYLGDAGRLVLVDMEHFFDGYKADPEFSLRALEAAVVNGASHVVLCDTNGGSLPHEIEAVTAAVVAHVGDDVTVGIHCHDDTGCAVANSMAAVAGGARHVQGTLNGIGERTGNANLSTIIGNLELKLGYRCLPEGRLTKLTSVSHHVAELLNRAVNPQAPYVGSGAFAHKAGLHASAIARAKDAYEHVDPEAVGNGTRFVVSEMAGRATITMKAAELGLPMDGPAVNSVIDDLKRLEHEGYHFEAADASLELLMRRAAGWQQDFFTVESMRVITDEQSAQPVPHRGDRQGVGRRRPPHPDRRGQRTGQRHRQGAARWRSTAPTPQLDRVHLTDFKVRILDGAGATGAVTRVLLDATDGERDWTTIGVSANIIEASWRALEESIVYGLLHADAVERLGPVAAPKFAPAPRDRRGEVRTARPTYVPDRWEARPARRDLESAASRSAHGLGYQGPDQGYALRARRRLAPAARAVRRRARRRRRRRLHGDRHAAGGDVRAGAGHPRPAHRVHDLGLPRPGTDAELVGVRVAGCSRASPTRTTTRRCAPIVDSVPEATLRDDTASRRRDLRRELASAARALTVARRRSQPMVASVPSGRCQHASARGSCLGRARHGVGAEVVEARRTPAPRRASTRARPGRPCRRRAPPPSGPRRRTTDRRARGRRNRTPVPASTGRCRARPRRGGTPSVTRQHTTCMPGSSPRFSQHPVR